MLADRIISRFERHSIVISRKLNVVSKRTYHSLGNRCIDNADASIAVDPDVIITFSIHDYNNDRSVAFFLNREVER